MFKCLTLDGVPQNSRLNFECLCHLCDVKILPVNLHLLISFISDASVGIDSMIYSMIYFICFFLDFNSRILSRDGHLSAIIGRVANNMQSHFNHRISALAALVSRAAQTFAESFRTPIVHHCLHISCVERGALSPHPLLTFKLENSISINQMGKLCCKWCEWSVVGHTLPSLQAKFCNVTTLPSTINFIKHTWLFF